MFGIVHFVLDLFSDAYALEQSLLIVYDIIVRLDVLTLYPENTTATALKTLNYG